MITGNAPVSAMSASASPSVRPPGPPLRFTRSSLVRRQCTSPI